MIGLADAFFLTQGRKNFQINVRASAEDRRAYFGPRQLNEDLIEENITGSIELVEDGSPIR